MLQPLELQIEAALVKRVLASRGECIKMGGRRGLPDRLVLMPGGKFAFVELKRPKRGRLSPHQVWWRNRCAALGAPIVVIDSVEQIDALIQRLM